MTVSVNYPYIGGVFLHLLSTKPEFKPDLEKFLPDLKFEIDSFTKDNNCTCKNKIVNFVNNNRESCTVFLNSFLKETKTEINLAKITSMFEFPDLSGTVHRTSEEEWSNFVSDLKNRKARFTSFSVVKDGESLVVYFI
jgi:hypothetical protein